MGHYSNWNYFLLPVIFCVFRILIDWYPDKVYDCF